MKILIVEDDTSRLAYFIENFYKHELTLTENASSAIDYLSTEEYDCIFLDHDLGEGNGVGADVASYLYENTDNPNNNVTIIIHTWNIPGAKLMKSKLPDAYIMPFGSDDFYSISG